MSWRNGSRFLRLLPWTSVFFALVACSKSDSGGPNDPLCAQHGPAFRVELSAVDGSIPPDTKIEVSYEGGLMESYRAGKPSKNVDVCCRLASATESPLPETKCGSLDGGALVTADAQPSTVMLCDVWSNGAATLQATAHGYEPLNVELMAQTDEQCQTIVTSEVTLVLERGDAGFGQHHPH